MIPNKSLLRLFMVVHLNLSQPSMPKLFTINVGFFGAPYSIWGRLLLIGWYLEILIRL